MGMPKGANPTIQDVVKYITDGDYRIPRFQRNFVWDTKKSASLIDSILKGYPIGSIILWKTKEDLADVKKLGGIDIPGKNTGRYTSYVIDGQQRLTSLYFALKGLTTGAGANYSEMYVSLIANNSEQIVYDELPKDAHAGDYVKLSDLYSASPSALGGTHASVRLNYFSILLQYTISVIEIDDSLGLDEVIEVFERLNLGGKKLSLFSIIAARSYKEATSTDPGFDLAEKYEDFNKKLSSKNYGAIGDSVFLQSIAACLIHKVNKADILKNLKSDLIFNNYANVEKAISNAIEHLKGNNYGVLVSNLLPYQRLIAPFAMFHYNQGKNPITPIQEKYLIDYFWRSVVGRRYNSSADTNMNADLLKIQEICDGNVPGQEAINLSPKVIFDNGRFTLSSAFVTGILCIYAQASPLSFEVGRTVNITNDAVSSTAKKQYHHFFPSKSQVIINNPLYKKNVNNVVNIVFMDALTNDQMKNNNPSIYTANFFKSNPDFNKALKSHFIEYTGYGLSNDDYTEFIASRSLAIFRKIQTYIIPTSNDVINALESPVLQP